MTATEIRSDLFKKIEHMSAAQLKEFYGIILNYFNSHESITEWKNLNAEQLAKIEKSLAQADEKNVKPISTVTSRLRRKYGLNG
jgi:hypothetical protein